MLRCPYPPATCGLGRRREAEFRKGRLPGTMITVSALPIRNAASSAEPDLTGRCRWSPVDAAAVAPLKPPSSTLKNDRFIALHMMYDRIAPGRPPANRR